jgi:hypothetical protein
MPDFQHLARWRIEEALAGKLPVWFGRDVKRPAFVAALAEEEPDQKNRSKDAEREQTAHHETGSTTAAVP